MGIQGLLPFLKKATRSANVKEYKGCTVAIDSYCWLHKGAFACAEKLIQGVQTDQYVYYCMKYVNFLLNNGIRPIMVFDGCHLPSKRDVEKSRRERRQMNKKKAKQLLREGKVAEARDAVVKSIDVTPQMALELMIACRNKGVDCIVAPYEADAQLAYLSKSGIAQLVITEDSDLVLFGCNRVMYKMDFNGNGMVIENRYLNEAVQLGDHYTFDKFRYICILSGCDYHPSLPGIGLAKASKIFRLTRQPDVRTVLKKIPSLLNMHNLSVSFDYIDGFFRALNTFKYQLVFDPRTRKLMPLSPYEPDVDSESLHYAGPRMSDEDAYQIALGNMDVNTKKLIYDFDPDTFVPKDKKYVPSDDRDKLHLLSIWNRNFRPRPKIGIDSICMTVSPQKRVSTKGKEVIVPNVSFKRKREEMDDDAELRQYTVTLATSPKKECKDKVSSSSCLEQLYGYNARKSYSEIEKSNQEPRETENTEPVDVPVSPPSRRRNTEPASPLCSPPSASKSSINKFAVKKEGGMKERLNLSSPVKNLSRYFKQGNPFKKSKLFESLVEVDIEYKCDIKKENVQESSPLVKEEQGISKQSNHLVRKGEDYLSDIKVETSLERASIRHDTKAATVEYHEEDHVTSDIKESPSLSKCANLFHFSSNGKVEQKPCHQSMSSEATKLQFKPVCSSLSGTSKLSDSSPDIKTARQEKSDPAKSGNKSTIDNANLRGTFFSLSNNSVKSYTQELSTSEPEELSTFEPDENKVPTLPDLPSITCKANNKSKPQNCDPEIKPYDLKKSSPTSTVSPYFQASTRPATGCRSVGLSKKNPKKKGNKQMSIANFLTSRPNPKKLDRKPLSPSKNNIMEATPENETIYRGDKSTLTRRKILDTN